MIFVTLGTHRDPMPRLINALSGLSADQLVVQHGTSPPPARAARTVAFMSFDEMLACFEAADVVVTHAGVGSVLSATRVGHSPIVVPRLRRLGEHVDDHQVELTRALAERRMVRPVWEVEDLPGAVAAYPARNARAPQGVERPIHVAVREALRGEGPTKRIGRRPRARLR